MQHYELYISCSSVKMFLLYFKGRVYEGYVLHLTSYSLDTERRINNLKDKQMFLKTGTLNLPRQEASFIEAKNNDGKFTIMKSARFPKGTIAKIYFHLLQLLSLQIKVKLVEFLWNFVSFINNLKIFLFMFTHKT